VTVGLLIAALLPLAAAAVLRVLCAPRSRRAGVLASVVVLASFGLVVAALPQALHSPLRLTVPWVSALGLSFSLLADGLSMLFALLITGIGLVIFTFATAYLGPDENRRRFFSYLLLFMGAMLGVVLSANLISLFVFWELTSISSFLLIGFWHPRERSRSGALKALVVTSLGGLAMLVGFVMLGVVCDSFEIPVLIERRELLWASPWAVPAALLILVGALTKSAQMPFHLWLPSAMEAPTPVSAYLHAATMVKAGLYLVARLGPLMGGIQVWSEVGALAGLSTMAWGSWMALRQTDLKALLAFSTVSQLGLILSLLSASQPHATAAGLFHLLNHGLFKGALFLLVGIIEHEAHSRDLTALGPLRERMPRVHALLAVAALSMAGMPPLGGFVSKEMFLDWQLSVGGLAAVVAVVGSILTAGYCFALAVGSARGRGPAQGDAAHAHDPGAALMWGPALLVGLAVALGLAPQQLAGTLIDAAAAAATSSPTGHVHLALWHGFSPVLAASALAIGGGYALYALWWQRREIDPPTLLSDRVYDAALAGLENGSRTLTQAYMSGYLWRYVILVLGVGMAGAVGALMMEPQGIAFAPWHARAIEPFQLFIVLTALLAGIGTVWARTRLAAILALGANGYALALLFSLLQAPDLALTQVMVETISVALFLAVFVFLPPYRPARRRRFRGGHLAFSAIFGFGVAALIHMSRAARVAPTIADYFIEHSVGDAGGHNVVNVILVDFRGLDTLGEITVLGVAALAGYAIVKGVRARHAA
jgi:multicomponent Na+:H+ antiporter subunit A